MKDDPLKQSKSEQRISDPVRRERLIEDILSSINDGLYALDFEWRFIYINQRAAQNVYKKPEDLIGKNLWEIFPHLRGTVVEEKFRQAMLERAPVHIESIGAVRTNWYDVSVYPSSEGITVYWTDITERRQLEEQIESLARFPQENPNPVMRISGEGNLTFANQASQPLLLEWGCKVGQPFTAMWLGRVTEALSSSKRITANFQCSNTVYALEFVPILEKGYVNLYARDVTAQVRSADALAKNNAELELRVQARTQEMLKTNEQLKLEITERNRVEESLRLSNAYNRSLIEASLDPLVTITPDGKVGDVNAATEAVTGCTRQELIGTDFHSYFTEPEKARAGYRQVFKTGLVRDYELEIRHVDGHITPVLYNASVYSDKSGEVMGVFAAARDITERKQSEQQRILLTTALEAAANGIIITDREGTILWANPALANMTGYARPEIIGRNPRFLQSGLQDKSFYHQLWETILSGQVWRGEITNRRKDGSLYPEEMTITPLLDPQHRLTYFIAIKQDISERKRIEQALADDRQRLLALSQSERDQRQFAESLAQANLAINASLELDQVFNHILDHIQLAIPYRAAAIILLEDGRAHLVHQHGIDNAPEDALPSLENFMVADFPLLERINHTHQAQRIADTRLEPEWVNSSGLEWVRSGLLAPLQIGERVLGFVNLMGDQPNQFDLVALDRLTAFASQASLVIQNAHLFESLEKSLAQEQAVRERLIQSEKFAATGRMLASVAHELNNPLQTIKNCLYLIKQEALSDSPIQEYLEMAFSETGRLANLVGQLRELYRPRGASAFRMQDLNRILEDVHVLLAPHLTNQSISWKQSPAAAQLNIFCDTDQIKQVFINICMNAIEAMQPKGGEIKVSLVRSQDGSQAGVVFKDTGPGIPPEIMANLFEPFTTTKTSGLGLGLSICYELVQRHNGQITVESQVNEGTTFTIWLPLVQS